MPEHYSDHDPARGCGMLILVFGIGTLLTWAAAILLGFWPYYLAFWFGCCLVVGLILLWVRNFRPR